MNFQNENLKNIFWLRPAYQRYSWKSRFQSLRGNPIFRATLLITCAFALALSILVLFGRVYLVKYFGVSKENAWMLTTGAKLSRSTLSSHPNGPREFPLDCKTWNKAKKYLNNYPTSYTPKTDSDHQTACPEYFRWIHEDLKPWKETGITREMVEAARKHANFRLVILDGKVYVEDLNDDSLFRKSFTIWGVIQLLRLYPGKLPNVEFMFDCGDLPVIESSDHRGPNPGPPALFRYCSDWSHYDIVFPDWTFWGWPDINIRPWRSLLKDIKEGNKRREWIGRQPYAYWKGNPNVAPWRKELMKCNTTDKDDWKTHLFIQNWEEEEKKGFSHSNIADQCTYRYKIFIEGTAWSVSQKYIFACDSPVLLMTPRFHDFSMRGMLPQSHYWPVKDDDKCRSLKFAVEYGNSHTKKAEAIGKAGSRFIHENMRMEDVLDYIFHLLNEYANLQRFEPVVPPAAVEMYAESMACPAKEKWRESMEESLEKKPSDTVPCTLPPPYDSEELKAFNDNKFVLTKEVEMWGNEYWENQIKNTSL